MRIGFLIYPGFDLLDLSGPVAVFSDAAAARPGSYTLEIVSAGGGEIRSSSGIAIASKPRLKAGLDTLMVVGGAPAAVRDPGAATLTLLARLARGVRRLTSVCTGAFVLAAGGLVDGKKVTTHWRFAAELQSLFPACRVDADRIFIRDGAVWTSAGATAGIDLALALVEDDLGLALSRQVARGLVVYQRRLGGQSQYSALLEIEPASDRIRQALAYARAHLQEDLCVARLAEVARLSVRQFSRAFAAETGMSPAKAVERLRAEVAKPHIEDGRKSLDEIARMVGFSTAEQMRQAFVRGFGRPPQAFRREQRKRIA